MNRGPNDVEDFEWVVHVLTLPLSRFPLRRFAPPSSAQSLPWALAHLLPDGLRGRRKGNSRGQVRSWKWSYFPLLRPGYPTGSGLRSLLHSAQSGWSGRHFQLRTWPLVTHPVAAATIEDGMNNSLPMPGPTLDLVKSFPEFVG